MGLAKRQTVTVPICDSGKLIRLGEAKYSDMDEATTGGNQALLQYLRIVGRRRLNGSCCSSLLRGSVSRTESDSGSRSR